MNTTPVNKRERIRLQNIASDYEAMGFAVEVQPDPVGLPDFLRGLQPDLIAVGKDEKVVIEVKARNDLARSPLPSALESAVLNRPGWRFELIIDGSSLEPGQTLSATEIRASLQEATELQQRQHLSAALLLLWSATEGALRLLALRENVELESLAPRYLLTRLYTLGLLGREQYQLLDEAMRVRNQAAHGFQAAISAENLAKVIAVSNQLVTELETAAA